MIKLFYSKIIEFEAPLVKQEIGKMTNDFLLLSHTNDNEDAELTFKMHLPRMKAKYMEARSGQTNLF